MRYIPIIILGLSLCSCLPVDTVLLPNPKRAFATGKDVNKILKIKTQLYKGHLTYCTKTVLENSGRHNIMLTISCAYYDKRGLVGKKVVRIRVISPKSEVRMYKRLFHIEQRYNWKCIYYDSDGVVYKKTLVRVSN